MPASTIELVAALANNGAIGVEQRLPWHLPRDLRHFRDLTLDRTVMMGRSTWESIGARPLPRRRNLVLTRSSRGDFAGAEVVHSLDDAVSRVDEGPLMVLGGAHVYALALPRATHLHLTRVHAAPPADTFFPRFDEREWTLVRAEHHPADAKNTLDMSFETWVRAATARANGPGSSADVVETGTILPPSSAFGRVG
jgi:dihydrofolate reductase